MPQPCALHPPSLPSSFLSISALPKPLTSPMSQNKSAPFSFPPSQSWGGNAGNWSTFIVRIGTPPQDFKILPSTNSHQTWIPVPAGCTSTDPPDCGTLRGALPFRGASSNGFLSNRSTTWIENGIYDLGIENHINLTGNGDYGYDTVGLGLDNSTRLTLTHQVVAGIATKDFYLGQFGLGSKPSNFTTYDDPIPSYLKDLVDSNLIPSFSYGYTAGAKYRKSNLYLAYLPRLAKEVKGLNGVFASLTFGGYDSSRSKPSNFTIPLASDNSRSLSVGVQSITASNTLQGSVDLFSNGGFFLIDSSVPDLWLPEPACSVFEQAFGLTFDDATNLYIVNDTVHERLLQLNPSVVFKIGIQPLHGPTVDINLPYGAFDLQASSPFYSNATNYFPLRRAANETQYTLGRTFLQEAHIIVDYERSNFSVNQAVFRDPNPEDIVTIQPKALALPETPPHHHHLSRGAIAGITVGAIALISAIITVIFFYARKHDMLKRVLAQPSPTELENPEMRATTGFSGSPGLWMHELDPRSRDPPELSITSLSAPARPRVELRGSSAVSELRGSLVGNELPTAEAEVVKGPAASELPAPPMLEAKRPSL